MSNSPLIMSFFVGFNVGVNGSRALGAFRESQKLVVVVDALERQQITDEIDIL